jgi:hypothetical protein
VYGEANLDPFNSVKVGEKPFFCDVKRLASQLNTAYELKLKDELYAPKLYPLSCSAITEKPPLKIVTPMPVQVAKMPVILEPEEKEDHESDIDNIEDTDNEDDEEEKEENEEKEEEKEEEEKEEDELSIIDSEDFSVEENYSEADYGFD